MCIFKCKGIDRHDAFIKAIRKLSGNNLKSKIKQNKTNIFLFEINKKNHKQLCALFNDNCINILFVFVTSALFVFQSVR